MHIFICLPVIGSQLQPDTPITEVNWTELRIIAEQHDLLRFRLLIMLFYNTDWLAAWCLFIQLVRAVDKLSGRTSTGDVELLRGRRISKSTGKWAELCYLARTGPIRKHYVLKKYSECVNLFHITMKSRLEFLALNREQLLEHTCDSSPNCDRFTTLGISWKRGRRTLDWRWKVAVQCSTCNASQHPARAISDGKVMKHAPVPTNIKMTRTAHCTLEQQKWQADRVLYLSAGQSYNTCIFCIISWKKIIPDKEASSSFSTIASTN